MKNIHLKIFTHRVLPVSLIPFITFITSYPLEYIAVQILRLLTLTSEMSLSPQPAGYSSVESPHLYIFRLTREVLMSTYSSYVHFMMTMILVHVTLRTMTTAMRYLADKLRTSTDFVNEEPQEKNFVSYTILLLLQYSLMYYVYVILCIVVSSLICTCFYTVHQPESLLSEAYTNQERSLKDISHQFSADSGYQVHIGNKHGDFRMLDAQETLDVIEVVTSIGLNKTHGDIYGLFQLNETRLWLFCEEIVIPVDISDYAMPQMLDPISIPIQGKDNLTGYYISPNAEFIIRSYYNGGFGSTYLTNISNPQTSIKFPEDFSRFDSYGGIVLTPDGGYLGWGDLDQFSTSSEELQKILTLSDNARDSVTVSNDGRTIFAAFDQGFQNFVLQTINITDPASPSILSQFKLALATNSLALSSDDKTLFILTDENLQILDVSDLKSPRNISVTTTLNGKDKLILSPDDKSLMIDLEYIVDVSDPTNLVINPSKILSYAKMSIFSLDSRAIFMVTETELQIATVYSSFLPDQQLSYTLFNLNTQDIPLNSSSLDVAVSPDGSTAYVVCREGVEIFEIVNDTVLLYKDRILETSYPKKILLSQDGKTAFVTTDVQMLVVNLTDKMVLSYIDRLEYDPYEEFALSPDGTTIMIGRYTVNVTDLRSPGQPILFLKPDLDEADIIAMNWEIIVVASTDNVFSVYNISNISSPNLIYKGTTLNTDDSILDVAISPDNQTLLINTYTDSGRQNLLQIYNISDPSKIAFLSTTTICVNQEVQIPGSMLSCINSNTVIISCPSNVLIMDTADPFNPFILGFVPVSFDLWASLVYNHLSDSGILLIFVADPSNILKVAAFKPQFIVEMPNPNVFYGEEFNNRLMLLQKNTVGRYTLSSEDYRFISFSLYNVTMDSGISTPMYTTLPTWITFNKVNGALRIQPTLQQSIGAYYTYCAISTQVMSQEFASIGEGIDPVDLAYTLASVGYIDDERYLTSTFNPNKTLLLPTQYNSSEKLIRDVLTGHYFDGIQRFSVKSLLSLLPNKTNIAIVSPSQFTVSASLSLSEYPGHRIQRCQFVEQSPTGLTPSFQHNFTTIHLEGFLTEVNDALANLIINLDDRKTPCNGTFTVLDGMNYPLTEVVPNVSNYFTKNRAPSLKSTTILQKQIDNAPPVYTETYFTIVLDESIFDGDNLSLNLELLSTDLESWLAVTNLALSGVPPEPYWPYFWPSTYEVAIRVTNQYKSIDTTFTLTVYLSTAYFLKLALKVLSAIGLWVYFYFIFNIFAKRLYRDPRNWILRTHEEVTPHKLFPIAFIGAALKESSFILTKLRKEISKDLGLRSASKQQLLEYFTNPADAKLDTDKLFHAIQSVVSELPISLTHKVEQYRPGVSSKRDLINQLILNEMVTYQLSTKEEEQTKHAFDRIKNTWTDLVQINESQLWQFSIDQAKLDSELESRGIYAESKHQKEEDMLELAINASDQISSMNRKSYTKNLHSSSSNEGLQESDLIDTKGLRVELVDRSRDAKAITARSSQVNMSLLQHALVAHAFKQQHLNADVAFVNILSKEQMNKSTCVPNFLARFLKLDLQSLLFRKGYKIGYGIRYKIVDDVLRFSGVVDGSMKNKTVVIQIVKKRGMILREIWVKGVEAEAELESFISNSKITDVNTQNTKPIM